MVDIMKSSVRKIFLVVEGGNAAAEHKTPEKILEEIENKEKQISLLLDGLKKEI